MKPKVRGQTLKLQVYATYSEPSSQTQKRGHLVHSTSATDSKVRSQSPQHQRHRLGNEVTKSTDPRTRSQSPQTQQRRLKSEVTESKTRSDQNARTVTELRGMT